MSGLSQEMTVAGNMETLVISCHWGKASGLVGQGFLQMFPDIIPMTVPCGANTQPVTTGAKDIEQRQAAETQQP